MPKASLKVGFFSRADRTREDSMRCRILSAESRSTPHRDATCDDLLRGGPLQRTRTQLVPAEEGATHLHCDDGQPREQDQRLGEDAYHQACQEAYKTFVSDSSHRLGPKK